MAAISYPSILCSFFFYSFLVSVPLLSFLSTPPQGSQTLGTWLLSFIHSYFFFFAHALSIAPFFSFSLELGTSCGSILCAISSFFFLFVSHFPRWGGEDTHTHTISTNKLHREAEGQIRCHLDDGALKTLNSRKTGTYTVHENSTIMIHTLYNYSEMHSVLLRQKTVTSHREKVDFNDDAV